MILRSNQAGGSNPTNPAFQFFDGATATVPIISLFANNTMAFRSTNQPHDDTVIDARKNMIHGNKFLGQGLLTPSGTTSGDTCPVYMFYHKGLTAGVCAIGIGPHDGTGNRTRIGLVRSSDINFDTGVYNWDTSGGASVYAAGYNSFSDRRLKENIETCPYGLDTILQLEPRIFDITNTGERKTGFIAQELNDHIPELVSGQEDDVDQNGTPIYMAVQYDMLTAALVKAIQE